MEGRGPREEDMWTSFEAALLTSLNDFVNTLLCYFNEETFKVHLIVLMKIIESTCY